MFCYSWELDSAVLMDWFIQFKLGGLLIIWPWLFEIHTKNMPQVHTDMPDISHPHPPKHGKRKACQLKNNLWETITFLWSWYLSNKFHYETLVGVIIISTVSSWWFQPTWNICSSNCRGEKTFETTTRVYFSTLLFWANPFAMLLHAVSQPRGRPEIKPASWEMKQAETCGIQKGEIRYVYIYL